VLPPAHCTELVVQAGAHDVAIVFETAVVAGAAATTAGNDGNIHRLIPEIVVQILRLHGPV
jgi:hypothetical protein